ncbi:hypothetical protein FHG87_016853 [Trinorchestia longiramus]|nr:hypothetical protein FHG87_016853 [Trinorchestia longiramus]
MGAVGEQIFVRLSLPDGLEELVEGVAREVLHSSAKDEAEIQLVAKNYFEKLVSRRKQNDKRGHKNRDNKYNSRNPRMGLGADRRSRSRGKASDATPDSGILDTNQSRGRQRAGNRTNRRPGKKTRSRKTGGSSRFSRHSTG